jgi:hypothetical protein
MITASKQIDRVSDSLTRLAQSRAIPARDIKPLLVRLDRVANTLDGGENKTSAFSPGMKFEEGEMGDDPEIARERSHPGPKNVISDTIAGKLVQRGMTPKEVTVDYLMENFPISRRDAVHWLEPIQRVMMRPSVQRLKVGSRQAADPRRQELMSVHHEDKVGAAEYFRENRKTPESLTAKDVADYLVIGLGAAKLILPQIQKMMQEKPGEQNPRDRDPQPNQMLGSRQTSKKKVAGQTRSS